MPNPSPKSSRSRLMVSLVVLVLGTVLWVQHGTRKVELALADEQCEVFRKMRDQAVLAEPSKAIEHLNYVVSYYPSGTKHIKGSELDRRVEQARAEAIHAIIADLRTKTKRDLGDDPEDWIKVHATSGD